jgi:hypothetical protein
MKNLKFLLLLGLPLMLSKASAQYFPLVQENRVWNTFYATDPIGKNVKWDSTYFTTLTKFEGDSLIGSVLYKKVYETKSETQTNWILKGCIREDDVHKVWYKPNGWSEDMIYDFNANPGDSLTLNDSHTYKVDSINYIQINAEQRKRFYISCYIYGQEVWIEGLGSLKGILVSGSACAVGGHYVLLCFTDNGNPLYTNTYFNDCYLISSVNEIHEKDQVSLVVTNDQINFSLKNQNSEKLTIQVFNIFGQMIYENSTSETELSVSKKIFSSGMYIYQLSSQNQPVKTGKFVIN